LQLGTIQYSVDVCPYLPYCVVYGTEKRYRHQLLALQHIA
jgi:hypothetical protein